jgi:hypothetical protein
MIEVLCSVIREIVTAAQIEAPIPPLPNGVTTQYTIQVVPL